MAAANGLARKRLGQFYTPGSEASSFANWAIRTGNERILEPSAGDGALLVAALKRAASLSGHLRTALACDIDRQSVEALRAAVGQAADVRSSDFFDLDPRDHAPVDVVLANPPFTRNHLLDDETKRKLRERYPLRGAAGLWAYFVLHARKFLRPGGRMLIVVPAAAVFAAYAQDLTRQLQNEFRTLALVELPTKPIWSAAADERGALILADGYQGGPATSLTRGVWSFETSSPHLNRSTALPPSFRRIEANSVSLGALADLSIGAVTGANGVFLLNGVEAEDFEPEDIIPIVARARQVRGVSISRAELESMGKKGERTWLLRPRTLGARGGPIRKRLAAIDQHARRSTSWFNRRRPWWSVVPPPAFDAVFTYMNDAGPQIALTEDGITCTNTLHCVRFKREVPHSWRMSAVVSFLSTFGQLAGELAGRAYGGGVLKFELKEARTLPVILSDAVLSEHVAALDSMVRRGEPIAARDFADELLLPSVLGGGWRAAAKEMRDILGQIRTARKRGDYRFS
jgi:adenine-specific DNA-methyltransferase